MSHAAEEDALNRRRNRVRVAAVGWSFAVASVIALFRATGNLAAGLAGGGLSGVADSPWVALDVALFVLWGMGLSAGLALTRRERFARSRLQWIAILLAAGALAAVGLRERALPEPWWPTAFVFFYLVTVVVLLNAPWVRAEFEGPPRAK